MITTIEMLYNYFIQVNARVIAAKREFSFIKQKINEHLRLNGENEKKFWETKKDLSLNNLTIQTLQRI